MCVPALRTHHVPCYQWALCRRPCTLLVLVLLTLVLKVALSAQSAQAVVDANSASGVQLTVLTTEPSTRFAVRSFDAYSLLRTDVQLDSSPVLPSGGLSAELHAYHLLGDGTADAAFLPYLPSAAEADLYPDLASFPCFGSPIGPIYNLPATAAAPNATLPQLVLSLPVLAAILDGNVTWWNDTAIAALNPNATLAQQPICMVLNADYQSFVATALAALLSSTPSFLLGRAAAAAPYQVPLWPVSKYACVQWVSGIAMGVSVVSSLSYSLYLSLLSEASELGATAASLINADGYVVQATWASLQHAMLATSLTSTRNSSGQVQQTWSGALSNAPGSNAWPLLLSVSVIVPRTFVRVSCQARSELAKFILFSLGSDIVRDTVAMQLLISTLPMTALEQLDIADGLLSWMLCASDGVNIESTPPILVVGSSPGTDASVPLRELLLKLAQDSEQIVVDTSTVAPPDLTRTVADQSQQPTIGWFYPMSFSILRPQDSLAQMVSTGEIVVLHHSIMGVLPVFTLPPAVLLAHQSYLPLQMDMELLANIFLGNVPTWADLNPRNLNPHLANSFNTTASNTAITLVFTGRGVLADAPYTTVTSSLLIALNSTQAFQSDPLRFHLPADWSALTARLTARGIAYVWVENEANMQAMIVSTPGCIGYKLSTAESMDQSSTFAMVRAGVRADGTKFSNTVQASSDSYRACAENVAPTVDASFLFTALASTDEALSGCWPLPLLNSIVLPGVIDTSSSGESGTIATTSICSHLKKAAQFAQYLTTDSELSRATALGGGAVLSSVPAFQASLTSALDTIMCDGQTLLWTASVDKQVSQWLRTFTLVAYAIGVLCALGVGVGIFTHLQHPVVRSSPLASQLTKVTGLLLLFHCPLIFLFDELRNCSVLSWIMPFGVVCTFTPVNLRFLRVYHLYTQRKLIQRKALSKRFQLIYVLYLGVSNAILLSVAQSMGGLLQSTTVSSLTASGVVQLTHQCGLPSQQLPIAGLLLASLGLVQLHAAVVAFAVRGVSTPFHALESESLAVYNLLLSTLLILVLLNFTGGVYSDTGVLLVLLLFFLVAFASMFLIFGYKMTVIVADLWNRVSQHKYTDSSTTSGKHTNNTLTPSGKVKAAAAAPASSRSSGGGGTATASSFNFPSLNDCSLKQLERYMAVLGEQLQTARNMRAKRTALVPPPPAATRGTRQHHLRPATSMSFSSSSVSNAGLSAVSYDQHPLERVDSIDSVSGVGGVGERTSTLVTERTHMPVFPRPQRLRHAAARSMDSGTDIILGPRVASASGVRTPAQRTSGGAAAPTSTASPSPAARGPRGVLSDRRQASVSGVSTVSPSKVALDSAPPIPAHPHAATAATTAASRRRIMRASGPLTGPLTATQHQQQVQTRLHQRGMSMGSALSVPRPASAQHVPKLRAAPISVPGSVDTTGSTHAASSSIRLPSVVYG